MEGGHWPAWRHQLLPTCPGPRVTGGKHLPGGAGTPACTLAKMASPFVNNLTQNGRLSIRRAEPDGGASHDDLDGGKMGDKRIRMGGKAGALGRGVKKEKEGRFAMVGRHGAAGGSSGRRSRQLGRQLHRRELSNGIKKTAPAAENHHSPYFQCLVETSMAPFESPHI